MTKATNSLVMKKRNQKMILDLIRSEEVSRAQIAAKTGLTKAAVTLLIEELIKLGLITESESDYCGVGRKPILLKLVSDRFYAVGVNITRKHCSFGIIDLAGNILKEENFCIKGLSPNEVTEKIVFDLNKIIKALKIKKTNLLGVGISTPGPIDYKTNTILSPPNFEKWHGFNLNILGERLALPIRTENIANAFAISEKYFGSQKTNDNFITVLVDEGIGSGIITEDKIHRGGNGLGNELGHISIDFSGRPCSCGNIGCLERYASIPALLSGTSFSSWKEVIDQNCESIIEKEVKYLSSALISVINLFDLKTVVLGGDLTYNGKLFAEKLYEKLKDRNITKSKLSVLPSSLENKVVIAGTLMIDRFFKGDDYN